MSTTSSFDLTGRVAFITGASKGIGLAIATSMAQFGAKVVISSRNQGNIDDAVASLAGQDIEVTGISCHVGKEEDIDQALNAIQEQFGQLDIIVNNAATNPVYGPIQEAGVGAFDKIMDVNVKAPFLISKKAYPLLKASSHASVINISSVEGIRPDKGLGLYSVSKAALCTLTQVMAKEWGPDGIRVNTICPGLVKTKFSTSLWQNEAMMAHVNNTLPLGRIAQPDEMAGLAVFLASDAASYCTGGVYLADGGYIIA